MPIEPLADTQEGLHGQGGSSRGGEGGEIKKFGFFGVGALIKRRYAEQRPWTHHRKLRVCELCVCLCRVQNLFVCVCVCEEIGYACFEVYRAKK